MAADNNCNRVHVLAFQTTIESSETTIPTATLKPEVFTTLPSSESDVWAQSDVSVCQEHRSCIFRGIVFVLGFEATAGRVIYFSGPCVRLKIFFGAA